MSAQSFKPIALVLDIFKGLSHSEPRVHPDRRDWESMTFYRRNTE